MTMGKTDTMNKASDVVTRRPGRPVGGQLEVDREQVLDAAERVIARDGAGASIEAVAAEAGVTNGYDHPTRLGADRWVAMIGAHARMRKLCAGDTPRPLVLVMVGTAVTVEAVDAQGHFLGGFILPGHGLMLRALESGTAGLRVPTGEVRPFPTNTSDALTSGGTYAIAGAVERMVQHVRQRCGVEPLNIMTGGAGWKMLPSMGIEVDLVESLIFDGLLVIAQERGQGHFPE